MIDEQCDDPAQVTANIRAYLKEWLTESVIEEDQGEVEFPEGASIHQLNLFLRARNTSSTSICDIDRYLDTPALH
jgi:hypothetical protein